MAISKDLKTVLVIEKSARLRKQIEEMLSFDNISTIFVNNSDVAIELVQDKLPGCILCDIGNPELDGYDLVNKLRQDAATATISIILLTAKSDCFNWREAMEIGANDYLIKPINSQELRKAVAVQLQKQAAYEERLQRELEHLRNSITRALPHELRTPLTGILTSSDFLLNELNCLDPSVIRDIVKCIRVSGVRLSRLIQNFLLFSELEQINTDPNSIQTIRSNQTASATAVIQNVAIAQTRQAKREEDLQLELQDASVQIGTKNLTKLVEELIDNACKFSPPGTPIRIASTVKNSNFILYVSDRGRGMSAEQIAQIGPYMQFERQMYEQQGTGLGLAIAQRLVELHQGELIVTSIPQKQTIVKVSLPKAQEYAQISRWSYLGN